jgi:hypothetical protein
VSSAARLPAGRLLYRQRIAMGMALLLVLLCLANLCFGLGLFGRFAKQAVTVSFVIIALLLRFYAPSIYRLRAYQRLRRARLSKAASLID